MTGEQFILVAGKIAASYTDPASCRTSVGRAYYGSFHLAAVFLKDIGIEAPKNANTHAFVRHRLSNSSHEDAELIGSLLCDLYADRIAADYDLDDEVVETIESARSCVERATRIQSGIVKCSNSEAKAAIKAGIEEYERKIAPK